MAKPDIEITLPNTPEYEAHRDLIVLAIASIFQDYPIANPKLSDRVRDIQIEIYDGRALKPSDVIPIYNAIAVMTQNPKGYPIFVASMAGSIVYPQS